MSPTNRLALPVESDDAMATSALASVTLMLRLAEQSEMHSLTGVLRFCF